jgi:hypothetical protein
MKYAASLRCFIAAAGLFGIWWGVSQLLVFRQEATISGIAQRIVNGDAFKLSVLQTQLDLADQVKADRICRPVLRRSSALVRLRIAEISNNPILAPAPFRTNQAVDAIRASLRCSPSDPFLWLVLFAIEPSAQVRYLSASYRLGPNEGWISLKRSPVAFAALDELPDSLRGVVVREFLRILEMGSYDEAAKIFVGTAWDKRELILSQMDRVTPQQRQNLAARLTAGGYDIVIPGAVSSNPQ